MQTEGAQGVWGFFVNECLNFDVLEEKISKLAKYTIIKNSGQLKGGAGAIKGQSPLPKYATGIAAERAS